MHCWFGNWCFGNVRALWLPCLILCGYHTITKVHRSIQFLLVPSIITGINTNAAGLKISSEPGGQVFPNDAKCSEAVGNRFLP